jgi:lycopene cyclase domain-containing protein
MDRYLYLFINLATISIPFIASFYKKAPFYKEWKYVFPAILITTTFFCVWDEIFTDLQIWGFNDRYILGIKLGSLPLEEILFFICIPYACIFTYFALNYLIKKDYFYLKQELISSALILLCFLIGIYFSSKLYTSILIRINHCFSTTKIENALHGKILFLLFNNSYSLFYGKRNSNRKLH